MSLLNLAKRTVVHTHFASATCIANETGQLGAFMNDMKIVSLKYTRCACDQYITLDDTVNWYLVAFNSLARFPATELREKSIPHDDTCYSSNFHISLQETNISIVMDIVPVSLGEFARGISLRNFGGFAIRRALLVINKTVVDPATHYFAKCNNNLCHDRTAKREIARKPRGRGGRARR